jgi:hypothetical protein
MNRFNQGLLITIVVLFIMILIWWAGYELVDNIKHIPTQSEMCVTTDELLWFLEPGTDIHTTYLEQSFKYNCNEYFKQQ